MTSLHVICDLGPPPIKNPGYAYGAEPPAGEGYGSLGAKHPTAGRFFVIFWKKMAILMRFGLHFARFQSHLKQQNC